MAGSDLLVQQMIAETLQHATRRTSCVQQLAIPGPAYRQ
jgi:hypothetical protein